MQQERRRSPRYRIDAEITVDDGKGRTIDLSSNSVYFEAARPLSPGDEVDLVFPFEQSGRACVKCRARVVRVDRRGTMFGIAATYEPISFSVSA